MGMLLKLCDSDISSPLLLICSNLFGKLYLPGLFGRKRREGITC